MFAKASVGTEDETQHEVSNRGAVRIIIMKQELFTPKDPTFISKT